MDRALACGVCAWCAMSLTEYEREREARVARNKAMLHSTVTVKLPLAPAPPPPKRTAKAPRGSTEVSRRSDRLGGMTLPSYADGGRTGDRPHRRPSGAPRTVVPDGSKPTLEQVEAMSPEELAKARVFCACSARCRCSGPGSVQSLTTPLLSSQFAVGGGINSGKGRRIQVCAGPDSTGCTSAGCETALRPANWGAKAGHSTHC